MTKTWVIYALYTGTTPFYVGASQNFPSRLSAHRRRFGKHIDYAIVDECGGMEWRDREHFWIEWFRRLGAPLWNRTVGRNGGEGLSEETRAKLSAAKRGKPLPPGTGAKISAALKGVPKNLTEEQRLELSRRARGKPISPEARAKISAAQKGRPKNLSSEQRKRRSEAMRGRRLSPDQIAKMAAAQRGRRHTEAHRAKNREAQLARWNIASDADREHHAAASRGRRHTEATKAKMSVAAAGRTMSEETKSRAREARLRWWREATPDQLAAFKAKVSENSKGRKRSPEAVAKVAAAHRGRRHSLEAVAAMRDARHTWWNSLSEQERDVLREKMKAGQAARRVALAQALVEQQPDGLRAGGLGVGLGSDPGLDLIDEAAGQPQMDRNGVTFRTAA